MYPHSRLSVGSQPSATGSPFAPFVLLASNALSLGNVFASGGQDTKMKEAMAAVAANFRGGQGEPAPKGTTTYAWNCAADGTECKPCISYNLKRDHPFACIVNGRCKYEHKCDRYVRGADGKRTSPRV